MVVLAETGVSAGFRLACVPAYLDSWLAPSVPSSTSFEHLVEQLGAGRVRHQLCAAGTQQLLFASTSAANLCGLDAAPDSSDLQVLWSRTLRHDLANFDTSLHESARVGALWQAEWRIILDDGGLRWLRNV